MWTTVGPEYVNKITLNPTSKIALLFTHNIIAEAFDMLKLIFDLVSIFVVVMF